MPANFRAEAAGNVLNLLGFTPQRDAGHRLHLLHVSGTYSASVPM
ncbi:MAG: hypothetical protein R2745_03285 [Vicinamibacterales bacterium]